MTADSHPAAWLQVVYLLDVAAQRLTQLTESSGRAEEARLGDICYSLDSSMLLTAAERGLPGAIQSPVVEVHSCNGQALRVLQPQHGRSSVTLACLAGNRAVISCRSSEFTVWDLLTGQQTGTVKVPGAHDDSDDDSGDDHDMNFPIRASRICVNSTASRLVYLGAGRTIVHIFDAVSLQALSSICTLDRIGSDARLGPCGLTSGASSFLLETYPQGDTSAWHLCSLETGKMVFSQEMPSESAQAPSLSEDDAFAAFVCINAECRPSIQIYDTRSGSMVYARKLGLPSGDDKHGHVSEVYLDWIGSCLLIMAETIHANSGGLHVRSTAHILVLQF